MYSIWLTFSNNDHTYLHKLIKALSNNYNAPTFTPHITVNSGIDHIESKEIEKFLHLKDNLKEIEVNVKSIEISSYLWKTLYLQINHSNLLDQVHQDVEQCFQSVQGNLFVFNPHISLMYKAISTVEKRKIIKKLNIKKSFIANGLQIVRTGQNINQWSVIDCKT